ncbi:MAG: endonuclease MutS2 [Candidatus Cloacimonetes bacterium]|nr:endonuclease MutS2 [Candidatus Cloacimonadota bacterium]MDD4147282.1 endonuclease MutS2 [Candidatus Cloacimonadota bacterium]MDD4559813.1 endonuclease MutS2 [Candidatus Cloacimonadota bacterium]
MTDREFKLLLGHLAASCHSDLGKLQIRELKPLTDINAMCASQNLIAAFQNALEQGITFDFFDLCDISFLFEDSSTGIFDYEELKLICQNSSLATVLGESNSAFDELPLAQKIVKRVVPLPQIRQAFDRIFDPEGDILDSASTELGRIRRSISSLRSRVQRTMQNMLTEPRMEGFLQEKFVTQRDDRFVIPVKESAASFVPGIVQSHSAKGATVFIEPAEIVPLNNELQLLKDEEKREIYRILSEYSTSIRVHKRELLNNQKHLARLDFLYAAARVANSIKARVPQMREDPVLRLQSARHPLLILKKIAEEGTNGFHKVIPFNLNLGESYNMLVLSGPNTGGKTVLMKAVGLITLMAMTGLPVPVDEESEIGCFTEVLADIGDDQSIENALSTFSSHLDKIGSMLKSAKTSSLILIDEIGAATDPQQGSALAQAILEQLTEKGVKGIVTTHYTALKVFAESHPHCVNAAMQFDMRSLIPTYHLNIGIPGDSFAIEVAASLGIDPSLIDRARELAGSQNLEFSNLIKTLQDQKKDLAKSIYQYELKTRNIQNRLNELDDKEREWQTELKARRLKHIKELQTELIGFQKLYNRELNELKALDKEERRKLSERKLHDISIQNDELNRELKRSNSEGRIKADNPKVGDRVWLADFEAEAQILSINGKEATVDMNGIGFKTRLSNLYRSTQTATEPAVPLTSSKVNAKVQTELKLLGLTFDEAMPLIDEFLDNAALTGFSTLRIVHGKGTGALRTKVREYLSRKKNVKSIETPPMFEGGSGVTVVKI